MLRIGALLFLLCLPTQDPAETGPLIKALASDSSEERDKALDRLVELGPAVLPSLRSAVSSSKDREAVARAKVAIEDIERLERERRHDADQKALLVAKRRDADDIADEKRPNWAATSGAKFHFITRLFKGGLVVKSWHANYLSRVPEDVSFDIVSITDAAGKDLVVERCGLCSPYQVYAKDAVGPVRVRLKGTHLWFSPYEVEFENPKMGDQKKVGDFTLEVAWPDLKLKSRKGWPATVGQRLEKTFVYELKNGEPLSLMGARTGPGGFGSSSSTWANSWCQCKDGPKPMTEKPKPDLVREFSAERRGGSAPLERVAKIRYVFLKPIDEPFDFTTEITYQK